MSVDQTRTPSSRTDTGAAELRARSESLQAALDAAEDAAAASYRLMDLVAREVRSPLQDVADLIESLGEVQLPIAHRRRVEVAASSITAVASLMETLGDLHAIDEGRLRPQSTAFDLRAMLEFTLGTLRVMAARKGLAVQCTIDPLVPDRLVGDAGRIRQLLLFAAGQAITVVASDLMLSVEPVKSSPPPGLLRFAVQNDGAGMSLDQLDHILRRKPLTPRADGSDQSDDDRLAVGFRIYDRLAQLLGGRLRSDAVGRSGFVIAFTVALGSTEDAGPERRGPERRRQELLMCSLGEVSDLSVGGMRVVGTRVPRGRTSVTLYDWQTTLEFEVAVVWSRRLGFRRREMGLRFVNFSPEQSRHLNRIWLCHSLKRVS